MALIHKRTGCTLGMFIRALRMGYGQIPSGFMRLSEVDRVEGGGHVFRCELYPFGLIPNSCMKTKESHFVWWSGDDRPGIDYRQIEGVRHLVRIKRPYSFYFDDDGKTI